MPRKPRFNLAGIPQHVIQRGNNKDMCFYAEDDYQRYLTDLTESANKYQCKIHAYVLMTNHVHLLVTPFQNCGVSDMMQALGRRYVYYINKTYNRTGTLWEGRYKSCLIDSERYLLTCMRYIELNPLRALMVEHPGEYKWSSYLHNAHNSVDNIISPHPVYTSLGNTYTERCQAYSELFTHQLEDKKLDEIRDALNQELVLGRSKFKDKIEVITRRQARLGKSGRPKIEDSRGEYIVYV